MNPGLPNYVTVGEGSYFSDTTFFRWGTEVITIGRYCSISKQVKMLAGGGHRTDIASTYPFDPMMMSYPGNSNPPVNRSYVPGLGITIGNDVWIGFGATIIGHVTIGDGAVIGAGAVVMKDVPPYGIVIGNPAQLTKYRFSADDVDELLKLEWWNWPALTIKHRVDWFYLPIREFLSNCAESPVGIPPMVEVTR